MRSFVQTPSGRQPTGQPAGRHSPPQSRVQAQLPSLQVHCDGRQSAVDISQRCVSGQGFCGQPAGFGSVHSLEPPAPAGPAPPELEFASPPLAAPLPPPFGVVPPLAVVPPSATLPPFGVVPPLAPLPPFGPVPPELAPPVVVMPPLSEPPLSVESSFCVERPEHAPTSKPSARTNERTLQE
jgi:hypothetical protein